MPMGMEASNGIPRSMASAETSPPRLIVAPTDRSRLPEMTTKRGADGRRADDGDRLEDVEQVLALEEHGVADADGDAQDHDRRRDDELGAPCPGEGMQPLLRRQTRHGRCRAWSI